MDALKIFLLALLLLNFAKSEDAVDDASSEEVDASLADGKEAAPEDDPLMPDNFKNGQMENVMSFKPPDLTEEEQHSSRLPKNLKCDGCLAVAYQISHSIDNYQNRLKLDKKKAPESDVIDLLEKVCQGKTFESYGLKTMGGLNRLSGPGTAAEAEPGMMQGGGRWPTRLATMCSEFFGEIDEYELYCDYLDSDLESLQTLLCKNGDNSALQSCLSQTDDAAVKKDRKDEL